jgi:hypothetical protein
MTTREFFYSPKGGQGCSTTAALRALTLSEQGKDVLLLVDHDQFPMMCAILNAQVAPGRIAADVSPHLMVMAADTRWYAHEHEGDIDDVLFDHVIIDGGVHTTEPTLSEDTQRVLVVRNCYLAMRASVYLTPDRVILVLEPGRALCAQDVEQVLPVAAPITVLPYDLAISRAVDAGLLSARIPKAARSLVST